MAERRRKPGFVHVDDAPTPGLGPHGRELAALALIGFCLFVLLALATFDRRTLDGMIPRDGLRNLGGPVGYGLADGVLFVLGIAGWIPCVFGIVYGVALFLGRKIDRISLRLLGIVVLAAMVSLLIAGPHGDAAAVRIAPYGPGGAFGAKLSPRLFGAFGGSGRILLLLFGSLCSLVLATGWLVSQMLLRAVDAADHGMRRLREPGPAVAVADGPADAVERSITPVAIAPADRRGSLGARLGSARQALGAWWAARVGGRGGAGPAAAVIEAPRDESVGDGLVGDEPAGDEPVGEALAGEETRVAPLDPAAVEAVEVVFDDESDDAAPADRDAVTDDAEATTVEASVEAASDATESDDDGQRTAEVAPVDAPEPVAADDSIVIEAPPRRAKRKRRPKPSRQAELPFEETYEFPPIELLREPMIFDHEATREVLDRNKKAIEQRLGSFKVPAKVVAASVGPAVTQYEVRLGEGIKLSRITSFEADLAAALRAVSVRVVAPIPGKDTVGIEVPNVHRQMVTLRELIEHAADGVAAEMAIPLCLGKDVAGEAIVEDMAKMPHLLIAGTTGSGKSVCVNAILLSILMMRTPRQVRLILIDPKMVELQVYKKIPHLACDVVTNMKKAPAVLEWAVQEMERRYERLSAVGTNHIQSYNKLGKDEVESRLGRPIEPAEAHLPYMVIVIDELADLMTVAQKDVEESIQRLAQKSRAVGLHVILATQRPSTDVITGVIKANLPSQIAFKVNRKIDSRVILDANGAEKLLGHGDMLYVSSTANRLLRAQGAFVSEEETHGIIRWIEDHGPKPSYLPELVQSEHGSRRGNADRDDLYDQAAEVILGQQRGSATLIQRALSVGYSRATRLLEMMEEDGLVGPFVGSKSREVMLTLEEWHEREAAIAAELAAAGDDELDGPDAFDDDGLDDGPELDGPADDGPAAGRGSGEAFEFDEAVDDETNDPEASDDDADHETDGDAR